MSIKCQNCGAILEDNALFCDECGCKIATLNEIRENVPTDTKEEIKKKVKTQKDKSIAPKQKIKKEGRTEEKPEKKKPSLLKRIIGFVGIFFVAIIMLAMCSSDSGSNSEETSIATTVDSVNDNVVDKSNTEEHNMNSSEPITEITEEKNAEYLGVLGKDLLFGDLLRYDDVSGKEVTFTGTYWSKTGDDRYLFLYREIIDGSINLVCDIKIKDESDTGVFTTLEENDYNDEIVITARVKLEDIEIHETNSGDTIEQIYVGATEFEILDPNSKEAEIARGDNYYFYVGETIHFSTGLEFTSLDTGIYTDQLGNQYVYLEAEISNGGESDLEIYASELQFYGDDYYMETGFPYNASTISGDTIAPGRKTKGYFYALCPNYEEVSNIEVQFNGVEACTLVLKDVNRHTPETSNSEQFEYVSSKEFVGLAGVYICMNPDNGGWTGQIEILEIDQDSVMFDLSTLDVDGPGHFMKDEAILLDETTAEFAKYGYTITFSWEDENNMIVTNSGTIDGMEAGTISEITDNKRYNRAAEFNDATRDNEYIFPESAERYLTEDEIRSIPKEMLKTARNEIFARHGYIFNSEELQDYFESTSWYVGTVPGSDFDMEAVFNDFEKENVNLIKRIENE